MFRPLDNGQFAGFGRSDRIGNCRSPLTTLELPATRRKTRRLLREQCPAAPGVYGMINDQGELIYVGKSKLLRNRLITYFQSGADAEKAGRIVSTAEHLVWERTSHEFAALMRELELIRRFRPRYNVQGQPGGLRRGYLCLGRAPAAYAYLSPTVTSKSERAYGPLSIGRRMRRAVERLNNLFRLRDCPDRVPMHFADQRGLFDESLAPKCLRYELGVCLGPCAGLCSLRQYSRSVRAAAELVEGRDLSALERLNATMLDAAAKQQFERAAALRDAESDMRYLCYQVAHINEVRRNWTFIYSPHQARRRHTWYLVRNGVPVGAMRAPTDAPQAQRAAARLGAVYDNPFPAAEGAEHNTLPFVLLVSLWFRRHPEQMAHVMPVDQALAHCQSLVTKHT
ncbi:MAG: GIY-YIG nuclease family protein [Planctomycetes bacterium]|nr:GIY-YIG nuclease family protein [Planctomycetota bacterium]